MEFYIQFRTENAAFKEDEFSERAEKARIIKEVAERIELGDISGRIRDINGNNVGCFGLRETK
jgi:hypothetical protein